MATRAVLAVRHLQSKLMSTEASLPHSLTQEYAKLLRGVIDNDFHPASVPDSITSLPRRKVSSHAASPIARLVFPEFTQIKADIHYGLALKRARNIVRLRREEELARKESQLFAAVEDIQGEWAGQETDPVSLAGPSARPMPVAIGKDEDFEGLFQFLQRNLDPKEILASENQGIRDQLIHTLGMQPGAELKWNTPMVEFKRGCVYEDGRLDLCKKVLGPTHVEKLFDALDQNTTVTQVLMGNNVISATGARRIAKYLTEHPDNIETWYLAGNHICADGFKLLVDAMVKSPPITNVWLKRNPLTPASVDNIVRLITESPNLRTLDLFNTELGDEGVVRLITAITGKDLPLRNIYLGALGAGQKSAIAIAAYLADPACKLESLFLHANPIGDAGALPLAEALKVNKSLFRLNMCSTGLSSTGVSTLCSALTTNPRILSVEFGPANTTRAFDQRYNNITDRAIPQIISLMQHPSIRHLDLGRTALSAAGLATIEEAVAGSNLCDFRAHRKRVPLPQGQNRSVAISAVRSALEANIRRFYPEEESYASFADGLGGRWLFSPEDVRLVDSVYRTRDNRYQKREPEKDVQKWAEGDPVWELVEEDARRLEETRH